MHLRCVLHTLTPYFSKLNLMLLTLARNSILYGLAYLCDIDFLNSLKYVKKVILWKSTV